MPMKNTGKIWIAGLCMLLMAPLCRAEIYKWVDENGTTHFSDSKPGAGQQAESLELDRINSIDSVTYDWVRKSTRAPAGRVTMYATSWCGYCKKARRYFRDNGVRYTEYDIEKDPAAKRRYDAMGGRGVPLILVGDRRMNGFSESGFERIYP